jgi:hypothetical protein
MNTNNPTNIFTRIFILVFLVFIGISRWRRHVQQKTLAQRPFDEACEEVFKIINRGLKNGNHSLEKYTTNFLPTPRIFFETHQMNLKNIRCGILTILSDCEILSYGLLEQALQDEDDAGVSLPVKCKGFEFTVEVAHSEWDGRHSFEITVEPRED